MTYVLAPGLHCCDVSERLVFLDVPGDRYFGLDAASEAAFRALLANPTGAADHPALAALVARAVLRRDPTAGPLTIAAPIAAPRRSLLEEPQPDAGLASTIRAAVAIARARRGLKRRGFGALLDELAQLKAGSAGQGDPAPIAAAFDLSRMLLDSLDQCLPHALALAGALFRRGCAGQFVIGVRGRPFRAHSWVQAGDRLLNDRIDHVRGFVPILAI